MVLVHTVLKQFPIVRLLTKLVVGSVDLLPRVNAGESRTLGYWGLRVTRRLLPVGIRESG